MIKKKFHPNFFDDLEFSYTFDLTYFESPRRCTETSRRTTLTGDESRKVDFWWIFEDFQGFSMHFGLHPNSWSPKIRPKPIFKKLKLEEKNPNFFNFFLIQSLCSKVTRKIVAHLWGPLGTCFSSRFRFSWRIFPGPSAHLPGDRDVS